MKSKTSTEYSYVVSGGIKNISNKSISDNPEWTWSVKYENWFEISDAEFLGFDIEDLVGKYLFFDGEYYGPIVALRYGRILTRDKLPEEMEGQIIKIYEKKSVTTTTYPPFYHKAKKGQSLYVKKNGAIGNEPDVYVKTGGTIKKLY